ncbi:YibE/F family protein [Periweissella cryptocerci]|uniref:YibE/F family protein n=1 Tax=Periweissella cryptocerci TaxID=2506420 RepID=A0A4P6YSD4_9LACO|nr:YibE/F family protein [Periweissella cryptocerci]QBO35571.1 YibE/F family protein [Periweissella cryptocerci]
MQVKLAQQTRTIQWRKRLIWLLVFLGGVGVILTHFDAPLYSQTVGQVSSVKTGQPVKETDQFANVDSSTKQVLKIKLLNGARRGQILNATNTFTKSGALDQPYKKGQQVFIQHQGKQGATITGQKRDTLIAFVAWIAVSLLIVLMQLPGLLTLLSVLINAGLLILAIILDLDIKNINVVVLFSGLGILMATITLILALGQNRQMLVTLLASLCSVGLALIIALVVLALTHERGMHYELMEYITQLPQPLFLAEALLAALGAVMDEATDIVATQFEVKAANPQITRWQLFLVGRNVGKTIMGALTSVLFLIFISSTLTMSLLYLRNGNSWAYTFQMNMALGLVQTIIAGIGIVLTVPVASWLAAYLGTRQSEQGGISK